MILSYEKEIRENEMGIKRVVMEEITSALKKMKSGKVAGMASIVLEMLKS